MTTDETNAERALTLILDDPELAAALKTRAEQICGRRACIEDGNDDPAWWAAMTQATNEVLVKAQQMNTGETH